MLFTIRGLTFCGLFLLLNVRNTVFSERCSMPTECFSIRNNKSCITVTPNTGNSDWYTSSSACETSGGRLLWLHDVNITDFTNNHLLSIINSNCTGCSFLWIGLMHSVYQDNNYFWKRTKNETIKQCLISSTCANCSASINQSDCELLGCCYRDHSCTYPGNITIDMQYEYDYHGRPYHGSYRNNFRHCVGLQKSPNGWLLRTVECSGTSLPRNGYICEYKCGMMWPTPSPRKNISAITAADTGCDKTSTTPISDLTTSSTEAENCTVPSSLKRCYPIPGRNSCLKLEHSNQSSNWFSSASACERDGGRLLWLFHQNVQTFMNQNTKTIARNACPNCTFLWIGLMQSTSHDDNFFWKRTQNETQHQCLDPPSTGICAVNSTRKECNMLGCCFNNSGCFYAANVTVDRQHEYHEMNRVNNSSPGYRRCVGLHKPSSTTPWAPSVYDCSEKITDIHGYFCEYRCGNDWPVPPPYVTTKFTSTTTSKSKTLVTIQTSTSTNSPNTVLSSTSSNATSVVHPTNVTAARNSHVQSSNLSSTTSTTTTTFNSSKAPYYSNITTTLKMTSGVATIAVITTSTSITSPTSSISSMFPAPSNSTSTLKLSSSTPAIGDITTSASIKSSTPSISSSSPSIISSTLKLRSGIPAKASTATTTSIQSSTSNIYSMSPILGNITSSLKVKSTIPAKSGITTTSINSSSLNLSSSAMTTSISQATPAPNKTTGTIGNLTLPNSTKVFHTPKVSGNSTPTAAFKRTSGTPTTEYITTTAFFKSSASYASSNLPTPTTTALVSQSATTNTKPFATSNSTTALSNATTTNRTSVITTTRPMSKFKSSSHLYSPSFHINSTKVLRDTSMSPNAKNTQLAHTVTSSFVHTTNYDNITMEMSASPRISQTTEEMLHKNDSASKKNIGKTKNENGSGGNLSTGAIVGISMAAILVPIVSSIAVIICIRHFSTTRIGTESPSPGISMSQTHEINIAFNTAKEPIQGVEVKGSGSNIQTALT